MSNREGTSAMYAPLEASKSPVSFQSTLPLCWSSRSFGASANVPVRLFQAS